MSSRQRTRLAAASSSSSSGGMSGLAAQLQDVVNDMGAACAARDANMIVEDFTMVESQGSEYYDAQSQPADEETEDIGNPDPCPIVDKDKNPFNLMLLPAEIRNEIYRACLTRPFNILLARKEPPPPVEKVANKDARSACDESDTDNEGELAIGSGLQDRPSAQGQGQGESAGAASTNSSALHSLPTGLRAWANRSVRPIRFLASGGRSSSSSTAGSAATAGASNPASSTSGAFTGSSQPIARAQVTTVAQRGAAAALKKPVVPRAPRPQDVDPLIPALLRCNKTVYQEARSILYSENHFTLDLDSALPTLGALHQRSRRQIKHVEIEIPCYNEILERFQETVRLGLRYAWGLRTFVVHLPFVLPGVEGSGTTGNTTVYANGFDILRWLPSGTEVVLTGNVCIEVERVVERNAKLAKTLDEVSYHGRQRLANFEMENAALRTAPYSILSGRDQKAFNQPL